jgi:hypothetical protein
MKMMTNREMVVKGDQGVNMPVAMKEVEDVDSVSGFKEVVLERERHGS